MGVNWLARADADAPGRTGHRRERGPAVARDAGTARPGSGAQRREVSTALWRVPAIVVVLLAIGACAQACALAVIAVEHGEAGAPSGLAAGQVVLYALPLCLLALASTVPLGLRWPLWGAVASAGALVVTFLLVQAATVAGVIALLLAVFRLGLAGPPGRRQYAAVALALPFLLMALASREATELILAAGVPIAAAAGIAVRAGRSASREDEARSVLSDALTEHMARGERARIARELHDVVAHHISMIAVQAETARLTTPGMPEAGGARLREISDTARAGLTEMRRLLGVLREDVGTGEVAARQPQPGLPQVAGLVDAARAAASASVRLIIVGSVASYDPGVELVAYRIVQEALTNARRHAPGAAVDVELQYSRDALRVLVRDNGPGAGPSGGAGHGLVGMRERAATVGGSVRAGAAPGGGFLVEAELPAKPDIVLKTREAQ
jgi:signal transduction histidine kinase